MTDETPEPGPEPITDSDVLLLRQVHPNHLKDDESISAEAFVPSRGHDGLLSTLHGRVGPDEAFRRHTDDNGLQSLGTYGVSVGEVDAIEVEVPEVGVRGLSAAEDGHMIDVADHVSIDFNDLASKGQRRQAARKLLEHAMRRGGALNS